MTTMLELDDELAGRVRRLAALRHCSAGDLMQEAIRAYVAQVEEEAHLCAELHTAWQQYQHDGLHLSADEADRWLAQLAAGEVSPHPSCHR